MGRILCVETTSKNCSVSVGNNGILSALEEEYDDHYCHGERLHMLIKQALLRAELDITEVDAFCFSSGPGSYTGLRIGAATIKGLAFPLRKPVVMVSTLKAMAWGIMSSELKTSKINCDLLCPVLDSRQGEVYLAMYNNHTFSEHLSPCVCEIIDFDFLEYLEKYKVVFFGSGVYKIKEFINNKNAIFIENVLPSAKHLVYLAQSHFEKKEFVDLAYFEPLYLKDFIPTKPKASNK